MRQKDKIEKALEAADRARKPDTRRVASGEDDYVMVPREPTQAMLKAGVMATYAGSGPMDADNLVAMERRWNGMIGAAPTRAQAASAGELCVRVADLLVEADVMETLSKSRKYTAEAREVYSWSARELRMMAEQTMLRTGAPTDGRSPNDGGYRAPTIEDAEKVWDYLCRERAHSCNLSTAAALTLNALTTYHAVIRTDSNGIVCPAGEKS